MCELSVICEIYFCEIVAGGPFVKILDLEYFLLYSIVVLVLIWSLLWEIRGLFGP